MGKQTSGISPEQKKFIEEQKVFFVGTAASEGRINISPKGLDSLRVIDSNKVVWNNLTGSGNETAAHLMLNPRMTVMFCAFDGKPDILRLYGHASIYHPGEDVYEQYIHIFPPNNGSRQIISLEIDLVQSSCGFAVPLMDFKENREILTDWAEKKGREGVKDYWKNKNTTSIDGFPTNIPVEDE